MTNHNYFGDPSILVLHIEDSPGDRLLMQKVLKESLLNFNITSAEDGEEGLQYLQCKGKFSNALKPDLIIMDLHMPRRSGFEILPVIKAHNVWKKIPLIVFSSSARDHAILITFDPRKNLFILKPNNFEGFKDVGVAIETFWTRLRVNPTVDLNLSSFGKIHQPR